MSSTVTQLQQTYAIDATHSSVEFVVRHMMITKVRGRFGAVSGSIALAPGSSVPTAIEAVIDASSVDTREAQRDGHLRSADFFDVERFPQLTYKSTRIEGDGESFRVYGDLTLHGVTREVVLDGEFEGRGSDPWGGQRVSFSAQTKINRKDFGLSWNQALETGGMLVSEEVRIELNVQAVLQQ